MSTLRTPLKYFDAIMDKMTKKIFIVLHEELHKVWVIKDGGGEEPFQLEKNKINLAYIKVDPTVVRVLYDKDGVDFNSESDKP